MQRCVSPYLVYFSWLNVMEQNSGSDKRKLLNGATKPQSSFVAPNPNLHPRNYPATAVLSQFHQTSATIDTGKYKYPDDDVTAEEDV
ncbi:hypothetical protein V8E53_009805 [Lactarius tabidus]